MARTALATVLLVAAAALVGAPIPVAHAYTGCPFLEFCGFFECTITISFQYPCGISCCPLDIDLCSESFTITFPCAPKFCLVNICDCDDEEACLCIPFAGGCYDCVIPIADPGCTVAWSFGGDGPFCFNGECMLCPCPGGPTSAPPPPPAPSPAPTGPPSNATPPPGTDTDPLVLYLKEDPNHWKDILSDLIAYNVYFHTYMPGWENVAFGHVWNLARSLGLMDSFQDPLHSMLYSQWFVSFGRQICLDALTRSNDGTCMAFYGTLLDGLFAGAQVCSPVNPGALIGWNLAPVHNLILATFQQRPTCPLSTNEVNTGFCGGSIWITLPTCLHYKCEPTRSACATRCPGSGGVFDQFCDGDSECDWCRYHSCTANDCVWNGSSGRCPDMGPLMAPGNTCGYPDPPPGPFNPF